MINVYISNSIYKDIDTKIDKDSSLYKIVTSKDSDVYLDLSDEDFEKRGVTMYESADDRRVKPRKVVFDLLLGEHEIGAGLSRAIFILSSDVLTDKKAKTIMYKYGVICCTPDNQEMLDLLFYRDSIFLKPGSQFNWSIFLKKISKLPCNSLIITDRFFMREDWWGTIKIDKQTKKPIINKYGYPIYENQFDNIKEIVNGYCHEFSVKELKILLFYAPDTNKENENDTNKEKKTFVICATKIANKIKDKDFFPQLKREKIVIEFYYIKEKGDDKQKDLYRSLHNRRIISNYSVMSTDYSFGSIKGGFEQRAQTPTIRGVFSFPSSVIEQDYYIDAICNALNDNYELASDARIACSIDSDGIHWRVPCRFLDEFRSYVSQIRNSGIKMDDIQGIDEPICNNLICDRKIEKKKEEIRNKETFYEP